MLLASCQQAQQKGKATLPVDQFDLIWVWEDDFTSEEKEKLTSWISEVNDAAQNVLGPFPFDLTIHFYRQKNASEPVPWAHTRRSGKQSVHFHVDPSFSLTEFREDWTAPHEISHVAIPFLGKKNSWFAEGFATYMQCQVMEAMNVMTSEEVSEKYRSKINANKGFFIGREEPFVHVANELVRKNHNYPAMYWGSVGFFMSLNDKLEEEKNYSLTQLISAYQADCRMRDIDMEAMMNSLDSLAGKPYCEDLMELFMQKPAGEVFKGLDL